MPVLLLLGSFAKLPDSQTQPERRRLKSGRQASRMDFVLLSDCIQISRLLIGTMIWLAPPAEGACCRKVYHLLGRLCLGLWPRAGLGRTTD